MPSSKPLPTADIYDWSEGRHREIRSNLDERRIAIAKLLQIDPQEKRIVGVQKASNTSTGNSVSEYIKHRNQPGDIKTVLWIDLVLDELAGMLGRFVMNRHNLNGQGSDPATRKILEDIAARDRITSREIEDLDLKARKLIATNYPGGPENFRKGRFKSRLVIEAAQRALGDLPPPKRGRPHGSNNKAAQELVHELAGIYDAYTGKRPSRSVVNKKADAVILSQKEGGRFLRFCECVIQALPADYQEQVTNAGGGLAALIRREVSR